MTPDPELKMQLSTEIALLLQGDANDIRQAIHVRYQDKAAYKSISLFSKGHRKCPASDVTEYIIKVFIAHALGSPELDLLEAPNLSS